MAFKLPTFAKFYETSGDDGDSGDEEKKLSSINVCKQAASVPTVKRGSGNSGELHSSNITAPPPSPLKNIAGGTLNYSGNDEKDDINHHFNDSSPTVPTVPTEKVTNSQQQGSSASQFAANDGPIGTRRPPGISSKLSTASKALDQRILDSGLSLTPYETPKPMLTASNIKGSAKPSKSQPFTGVLPSLPEVNPQLAWLDLPGPEEVEKLGQTYYIHHNKCNFCIAAGRGKRYGPRCAAGMSLWAAYQSATGSQYQTKMIGSLI